MSAVVLCMAKCAWDVVNKTCMGGSWSSDRARHFSNRCASYKVARVVHGNRSDNHCNRSDTRSSVLLQELH